jgi:hypothetical protein
VLAAADILLEPEQGLFTVTWRATASSTQRFRAGGRGLGKDLVRSHWGVEINHHTLDTAFVEDERPWIVADGNGMLVTLVLRRIAYTLLALFRGVSLRGEQKGEVRWADLLRWVWSAIVAATDAHLDAIRLRKTVAVWS